MGRLDHSIKLYLLVYLCLLIITLIPQLFYSQDELFLVMNGWHTKFFDLFFYAITFFGDGLTFALLIIVLFFFSYRKALLGLLIFLFTAGLTQLLKRLVFDDQLRPFGKLGNDFDLYIPEGITPLIYNSFPSGHTTTAFALAAFLGLIFKQRTWWPVFLTLATLAGYSRVYLTHHFPLDVWVGSIIGTLGAIFIYVWLDQKFADKFGEKGLLSKR